ncbi:MAG: InlB B-repeat-containing protein [Olegusella sp.]|nr:InlB B-repeat-containing protein [Olegusella sp.]
MTLYANGAAWKDASYGGSVRHPGSTGDPAVLDYHMGQDVTLPVKADFTRLGWTLEGWSTIDPSTITDPDSPLLHRVDYRPGETFQMGGEAVKLWAVWNKTQYTILYVTYTGTFRAPKIVEWEATDLTPEDGDPSLDGTTFAGWYTDDNHDLVAGDKPRGMRVRPNTETLADLLRGGVIPDDERTQVILYAWFVPEVANLYYDVFDQVGGTVERLSESVRAHDGKPLGSRAIAAQGYEFIGWYDSEGPDARLVSRDPNFQPSKGADEVWVDGTRWYARFAYNTYTIRYNDNGADAASVQIPDQHVGMDEEVNLTPMNDRYVYDGYVFRGWSRNPVSGVKTEAQVQDVLKDGFLDGARVLHLPLSPEQTVVVLYAVWQYVGFHVYYDLNGQSDPRGTYYYGYLDDGVSGQLHNAGDLVQAATEQSTNNAHRVGYIFDGWSYVDESGKTQTVPFGKADGTGGSFTMLAHDMYLTPNWVPTSYTVFFLPGDATTIPEVQAAYSSAYANSSYRKTVPAGNSTLLDENGVLLPDGTKYYAVSVRYDESFNADERFISAGYEFLGWNVTGATSLTGDLNGFYAYPGKEGDTRVAGWLMNFTVDLTRTHIVTFTAVWKAKPVAVSFYSSNDAEGQIGGKSQQQVYAGSTPDYDEVVVSPEYKKYLKGWQVWETSADGATPSTPTKYTGANPVDAADLTIWAPDAPATWTVHGPTTFIAVWADAYEVWYFEGKTVINPADGTAITGDFYEDHGYDAGHPQGLEGATRFTHVNPNGGLPAYNGMENGYPRGMLAWTETVQVPRVDAKGDPVNDQNGNQIIDTVYVPHYYTFLGWAKWDPVNQRYTQTDGSGNPVVITQVVNGVAVPVADLSAIAAYDNAFFAAVWAKGSFFVEFDANLGKLAQGATATGAMPDQTFEFDVTGALAKNQYHVAGYDFVGWSTSPVDPFDSTWTMSEKGYAGTGTTPGYAEYMQNYVKSLGYEFFADQGAFTRNNTQVANHAGYKLYAVWQKHFYNVQFKNRDASNGDLADGGAVAGDSLAQVVDYYASPSAADIVAKGKGDYILQGWEYQTVLEDGTVATGFVDAYDADGKPLADFGLSSFHVCGPTTLWATWELTYSVTYNPGDHGATVWTDGQITKKGYRASQHADKAITFDALVHELFPADEALYVSDSMTMYGKTLNYGAAYGDTFKNYKLAQASDNAVYFFYGWLGSNGRFYQTIAELADETVPVGGLTLTAQWIKLPVLVKFDPNGGTAVTDDDGVSLLEPIPVIPYSKVALPMSGSATKPGYVLDGWTYGSTTYPVTADDGGSMPAPTHNITLMAHWSEKTVTVTYRSESTNKTGDGYITGDAEGISKGVIYVTPLGGTDVDEDGYPVAVYNSGADRATHLMAWARPNEMAQKLTAKNGHALDWTTGATVANAPYAVTAVARDGYHFLYWVDEHNNVVETNPVFVVKKGAAGYYEDAVYYAIFTENDDVHIQYKVSDPARGWLARNGVNGEYVAPSTGTARGTQLMLVAGYDLKYWIDEHNNIVSYDLNFTPKRVNTTGHDAQYTGLDIYEGHIYTAVIVPKYDMTFTVEQYLQKPGETAYEIYSAGTITVANGPHNSTVAVIENPSAAGSYILVQVDYTTFGSTVTTTVTPGGWIWSSGANPLLDSTVITTADHVWTYDPVISSNSSHLLLTDYFRSTGDNVIKLYYTLADAKVARVVYKVETYTNKGVLYGNGDYGSVSRDFEVIPVGYTTPAQGATALPAPPGFSFAGWYWVDEATGTKVTSLGTTVVPAAPTVKTTGWANDVYYYTAMFVEDPDITVNYTVNNPSAGSVSVSKDTFAPVTGVPQVSEAQAKAGWNFSHWEDAAGNWVLVDGTVVAPTAYNKAIHTLMPEGFRPQWGADGTYKAFDGKTFKAVFLQGEASFTVERYRVVGNTVINERADGTIVTGLNLPWDSFTPSGTSGTQIAVVKDADDVWRIHEVVYGLDINGLRTVTVVAGGLSIEVGTFPGYELDLTFTGTVDATTILGNGTAKLKLFFIALADTAYYVERWVTDPSGANPWRFDSADYKGVTDSYKELVLTDEGGTVTDAESQIGVATPKGYMWDASFAPADQKLSGYVAADGSLHLKVFFKSIKDGSKYSVEHWIVDGDGNATLIKGDYDIVCNAGDPAGPVVAIDPATLGRLGYEATYTTTVIAQVTFDDGTTKTVETKVTSNPSVLHLSGDPDNWTKLRVFYLALGRVIGFQTGTNKDDWWSTNASEQTKADRTTATGKQEKLPAKVDVERPGYTFWGWSIDSRAVDKAGVASQKAAEELKALEQKDPGKGWLVAPTDTFEVPEVAGPDGTKITLYAVWYADKTNYDVEVWAVRGDGRIEHLSQYDVHAVGAVGDTVDYTDPTNPIESWGTTAADRMQLKPLGYNIDGVPGYRYLTAGYTTPAGIAIASNDATAPAGSKPSDVLLTMTKTRPLGATLYLFYEADGTSYHVARRVVIGDKVYQLDDTGAYAYQVLSDGTVVRADDGTAPDDAYLRLHPDTLVVTGVKSGMFAEAVTTATADTATTVYYTVGHITGFDYAPGRSTTRVDIAGDGSSQLVLYYEAHLYDLKFGLDGGARPTTVKSWDHDGIHADKVYTSLEIEMPGAFYATRPGYTFLGWREGYYDTSTGTPIWMPVDYNGDGVTEYRFLDSDGDGVWDVDSEGHNLYADAHGKHVPMTYVCPAYDDSGATVTPPTTPLYAIWDPSIQPYEAEIYFVNPRSSANGFDQITRRKDLEVEFGFLDPDTQQTKLSGLVGTAVGQDVVGEPVGMVISKANNPDYDKYFAGYTLRADGNGTGGYSSGFGESNTIDVINPLGTVLKFYFVANEGVSKYIVEYWYWGDDQHPHQFSSAVAPTVVLYGTAGRTANVVTNNATYNSTEYSGDPTSTTYPAKAKSGKEAGVTGTWPDESNQTTSLSYLVKYIEGYVFRYDTEFVFSDNSFTDPDGIFTYTYTDDSGNKKTMDVKYSQRFKTLAQGKILGDGTLVLQLFYQPDVRNVTFNPNRGAFTYSGADKFSSSNTNVYRTDQQIAVPDGTYVSRAGYRLRGWTRNPDVANADYANLQIVDNEDPTTHARFYTVKLNGGSNQPMMLYTDPMKYTVTKEVTQTLWAVWEPVDGTEYRVEHYRVVGKKDASGNITEVTSIEKVYTTTQYGKTEAMGQAEYLVYKPASGAIAAHWERSGGTNEPYNVLLDGLLGYTYYKEFGITAPKGKGLTNVGASDYEISGLPLSTTGLPDPAAKIDGGGSTVLRLYYFADDDTKYYVQFWKVTGMGERIPVDVSTVLPAGSTATVDSGRLVLTGTTGTWAKADYVAGDAGARGYTTTGYTDGLVPITYFTNQPALYSWTGYTYTANTININGTSWTSEPYDKILGGGLTTIDLYLMPDEYDVKLEIDLLATDATWNFSYNDTGKEFLQTGTYNAYTDSGTGKVYVGYAKRQVKSKQIVDLPKSSVANRPGYVLKGWLVSSTGTTNPAFTSPNPAVQLLSLSGQDSIDYFNTYVRTDTQNFYGDFAQAANALHKALAAWEFETPEVSSGGTVTLYAVWVATQSPYEVWHYKVKRDGTIEAMPSYKETVTNPYWATDDGTPTGATTLTYATDGTVTRTFGTVGSDFGVGIRDTTKTFTSGGVLYDFRGYTNVDLLGTPGTWTWKDALGVTHTMSIDGGVVSQGPLAAGWTSGNVLSTSVPAAGTGVLKLYYLANDDTKYYVEHYIVRGDKTINQVGGVDSYTLREELKGETDSIVYSNDLYVKPTNAHAADFAGYEFVPYLSGEITLADGTRRRTTPQSAIIKGDGTVVFKLYYRPAKVQLTFETGTSNDSWWKTTKAVYEKGYEAGSNVKMPVASDVERAGYTLIGWYKAADATEGMAITNLRGTACKDYVLPNPSNFYAVGSSSFIMPGTPTTLYAVYAPVLLKYEVIGWKIVPDASGNLAVQLVTVTREGYDGDDAQGEVLSPEVVPGGYHLLGSVTGDPTSVTTVGTNAGTYTNHMYQTPGLPPTQFKIKVKTKDNGYGHLVVDTDTSTGVNATPQIRHIFIPNTDTKYKIEHWIVPGDGTDTPIKVYEDNLTGTTDSAVNADGYVLYYDKTGALTAAPTSQFRLDDTAHVDSGAPYTKGYKYHAAYVSSVVSSATEKYSGKVTADASGTGTLVLRIYYTAANQNLRYYLGFTDRNGDKLDDDGRRWTGTDASRTVSTGDPTTAVGGNPIPTGEKITIAKDVQVERLGYDLVGWYRPYTADEYRAATPAQQAKMKKDGKEKIAGLYGKAAWDWYQNLIHGKAGDKSKFIPQGTTNWAMPGEDVDLYAVWVPRLVEFEVQVYTLPADGGAAERKKDYDPKGNQPTGYTSKVLLAFAGDMVHYDDPTAPYEAWGTPPAPYNAGEYEAFSTLRGAGYDIPKVHGYVFSQAKTLSNLGAYNGVATDPASISGKLVLKLYYEADPNATDENTFYVVRHVVPVDVYDNRLAPVNADTTIIKHNAPAGSWVKVDELTARTMNPATQANPSWWADVPLKAKVGGGWEYGLLTFNGVDYDYAPTFSQNLPAKNPTTLYTYKNKGQVTGHDATDADKDGIPDGALVLHLYFTVHYYTLTFTVPADCADMTTVPGEKIKDDPSGQYPSSRTFKTPADSDVKRDGYKLIGWHDTSKAATDATGDYALDAIYSMPHNDLTLDAVWQAVPVKFVVEHWKVDPAGNETLERTDEYYKAAGTAVSVGDFGAAVTPDIYAYVSGSSVYWPTTTDYKPGTTTSVRFAAGAFKTGDPTAKNQPTPPYTTKLNQAVTAAEQAVWEGYRHDPTYSKAVESSLSIAADGSLVLKVYYRACKVEYKVELYKVTGDNVPTALTSSPVSHYGYVGYKAVADGNAYGRTAAGLDAATTTHYELDDKSVPTGYRYKHDGFTFKGTDYTTASGVNKPDTGTAGIKGDGSTVLKLYFEPLEHTLKLHVVKDYGKFTGKPTGAESNDDLLVTYKYYTEETTDAMPADVKNAAGKHFGTSANPYRAGYGLVGWSTDKSGANTKAAASATKAAALKALPAIPTSYTAGSAHYFVEQGKTFVMPDANLELWAVWEADKVKLTLKPAKGAWTAAAAAHTPDWNQSKEYYVDETIDMLPAQGDSTSLVKRDKYELVGWSVPVQASVTNAKGLTTADAAVAYGGDEGYPSLMTAAYLKGLGNATTGAYAGYPQFYKGATGTYTMTPFDLTLTAVWQATVIPVKVHHWKANVNDDGKLDSVTEDGTADTLTHTYVDSTIEYAYYDASAGKIMVKATPRTIAGYIFQDNTKTVTFSTSQKPTLDDVTTLLADGKSVTSVTTGKILADGSLRLDLFYIPDPDTPYLIHHYRIDGNEVGSEVAVTKHTAYAGSHIKPISAVTDGRLYPTTSDGTTAGTALNWKGYTAQVVDWNVYQYYTSRGLSAYDASRKAILSSSAHPVYVTGDKNDAPSAGTWANLYVVYLPDTRKLILDLGEYVTATGAALGKYKDDGTSFTWTYYLPPNKGGADWKTGMTDVLPSSVPERAGYTFLGWSNNPDGVTKKGTYSREVAALIKGDPTKYDFVNATGSCEWTFPQVDASGNPYRMYAVWQANDNTKFVVERYRVTMDVDGSGTETARVEIQPTSGLTNQIPYQGVTDDYADMAVWGTANAGKVLGANTTDASLSTHGYFYMDWNDKTNTAKVPKGFNFVGDGQSATLMGSIISFTEPYNHTVINATTDASDYIKGDGTLVLRLFYVARPIPVIFNVVDHRSTGSAKYDDGKWVGPISYSDDLGTTEKPYNPTSGALKPAPTPGSPSQEVQKGWIYAGQKITLPLMYVDNTALGGVASGEVAYDGYSLLGWSMWDDATTKDDFTATPAKKNFDIRDGYAATAPYTGITSNILFGAKLVGGSYQYDGVWTVPDDIEDMFEAESVMGFTAGSATMPWIGMGGKGLSNYNALSTGAPWVGDRVANLWAVFGLKAQLLIFDPCGRSTQDQANTYLDPNTKMNVVPSPAGAWDTSTPSGATYAGTYSSPGKMTNLGDPVPLASTSWVDRPGYRLIGWTSNPNKTDGLMSTSWGGSTYTDGGKTYYEIDYRNGNLLMPPSWNMPNVQSTLTMYAVYEPMPVVIHYKDGIPRNAAGNILINQIAPGDNPGTKPDEYGYVDGMHTAADCNAATVLAGEGFSRKGWEFVQWKMTDASGNIVFVKAGKDFKLYAGTITTITTQSGAPALGSEITLTAVWKQKKYTVVYKNPKGNDPAKTTMKNYVGPNSNGLNKNIKVAGYTFKRWVTADTNAITMTAASHIYEINPDDDKPNNTITVSAVWKTNYYTVHYDINGGTLVGRINDKRNLTISSIGLYSTRRPEKPGYDFDGWWSKPVGGIEIKDNRQKLGTIITAAQADGSTVKIYAHWKRHQSATGGPVILPMSVENSATVLESSAAATSQATTQTNTIATQSVPKAKVAKTTVASLDALGNLTVSGLPMSKVLNSNAFGVSTAASIVAQTTIVKAAGDSPLVGHEITGISEKGLEQHETASQNTVASTVASYAQTISLPALATVPVASPSDSSKNLDVEEEPSGDLVQTVGIETDGAMDTIDSTVLQAGYNLCKNDFDRKQRTVA